MKNQNIFVRKTNPNAWIYVSNLPRQKTRINWNQSSGSIVKFNYDNISGEFIIKRYDTKTKFVTIQYKNLSEYSLHISSFKDCNFLNYITPKNEIIEINKDKWIDTSLLPRRIGDYIDWENCNGKICDFQYKNIKGALTICEYIKEKQSIYIKYLDNPKYLIKLDSFLNCKFKSFLEYKDMDFKYNINDEVHTKKLNCIIHNRRTKNIKQKHIDKYYNCHVKQYRIECLDCGYGIDEEWWVDERRFNDNGNGCPCCTNQIVVHGINDITTTDPWMIPYFQGGYDEAKLYTSGSNKRIYPICPDCRNIKHTSLVIQEIRNRHSIGCECSDSISYPNKFSYEFLKQLPVNNVEHEWTPEWIKPKRYDNYFEYNGRKYVLELDGLLGHGNKNTLSNQSKDESKYTDIYKDKMAIKHNITPIRIDCAYTDAKDRFDYVKNNMLHNEILSNLFDLSQIDWIKCGEYATSNIIKEVCEYWERNNSYAEELCDKYNICYVTLQRYLKEGAQYGWCTYDKKTNRLKSINSQERKYNQKIIRVYDDNLNFIFEYDGLTKLCNNSQQLLGFSITSKYIMLCCNKKREFYKGFTFRYADDDELYEINNFREIA